MGSLMAGWSSPFQDPNYVKVQRNRSLTREEIDAYWKSKEEERLCEITGLVQKNQDNIYKGLHKGLQEMLERSISLPPRDGNERIPNSGYKSDAENIPKINCWWTTSNSAFLNEPPVTAMEGPSYKYASQYHVKHLGSLE